MFTRSHFVHEVDTSVAEKFFARQAVASPIRLFDVSDFDIDAISFLKELAATYEELPFDYYDIASSTERLIRREKPSLYSLYENDWLRAWNDLARHNKKVSPVLAFWQDRIDDKDLCDEIERFQPYRRRGCFEYLVTTGSSDYRWRIQEGGSPIFAQKVTDSRSRIRKFAAPPMSVYRNDDVLKLIGVICELVSHNPSILSNHYRVTMHQMLTYANNLTGSTPAPEGTHQDGASFIVSALVLQRENVQGGVSKVYYSKNKELAFEHELKPGEGIVQSDGHHNLWHDVTPIFRLDELKIAYRSILGLDITF